MCTMVLFGALGRTQSARVHLARPGEAWSGPGSWSPKHFMPGRAERGSVGGHVNMAMAQTNGIPFWDR